MVGVVVLLSVLAIAVGAVLFTAPDAEPSDADELFEDPAAEGGALCFRAVPVDGQGGLVVSVDERDPNHTVRYVASPGSVTRTEEYHGNDTRITVHSFSGEVPGVDYRSRLRLVRNDADDNDTVVADDGDRRIRFVDRDADVSRGEGIGLLVPSLGTLDWRPVNDTAYRPVGGWVTAPSGPGKNRTSYVSSASGVVRTDGSGTVRRVDVTYTVVDGVEYRVEALLRDGQRIRVTFDREFCRPSPTEAP